MALQSALRRKEKADHSYCCWSAFFVWLARIVCITATGTGMHSATFVTHPVANAMLSKQARIKRKRIALNLKSNL
jgi:hypothetical protein